MKNILFDVDRTLVDSYYSEMITLKQAIKEERYEDAAKIRDEIKNIEEN